MERRMKDSGIKWIGEIPENWKIRKIKHDFLILDNLRQPIAADKRENILGLYDYYGASGAIDKIDSFNVDDKVLLIGEDGANLLMRNLPLIYKASGKIWVNNHAHILKPINNDYNYMAYMLEAGDYTLYITGSAQPKLSQDNIKNFLIVVPPLSEQQRISDFLDKKCTEIDELVSIQEQYIEELKAYKQSVITEAVTKGLNPNAEMKDSGVEWIGEIPKDWDIRKIKFIGKAENGLTYSPADVCDEKQGILVLRSSNIQNDQLDFNDNVYVNKECESLKVRKGDIIICSRNGSASLVGKNAMVTEDINATFGAFMMRFRSDYFAPYIKYLLQASISNYKTLFFTTTVNQLTIGIFNSLNVPFTSSFPEQQEISQYLDKKTSEIDSLIQIKQEKIEQLNFYKKSLIYEYVTGKKQVLT